MKGVTEKDTIKTITTHYIDGAFVESHGREVMDIIKPTNGKVIGRVTLGDEEDTRRAIAAAKRAFASFGRTTMEERSRYLRELHKAVSARKVRPAYCGVGRQRLRSGRECTSGTAAERKLGQDDGHARASRRCWPDYRLERERAVHLPEAGISRSGWLYSCYQAERDELAADTGDG